MRLILFAVAAGGVAVAALAVPAGAQTPVNGITTQEVLNSYGTLRPTARERKLAWLDAVCKSRRPQARKDCAEAWAKIRAARVRLEAERVGGE